MRDVGILLAIFEKEEGVISKVDSLLQSLCL